MIRTGYSWIRCVLLLGVVSASAPAQDVSPSLARAFLKETSLVELPEPVKEWDKSMRELLRGSSSPAVAVKSLSSRYHLSRAVVSQLIELWARTTILSWKDSSDASKEKAHRLLDTRFIGLAKAAHYDPLVLAIAAEAITYIGRCNVDTYRALVGTAPDAASAWSAAEIGYCGSWLQAFSELHPDKAATVEVRLALGEELARPQSLALNEHLASNFLRDHTTPGDYQLLRNLFAARHVDDLFDVGFVQQGLAFFQALPDDTRRALTEAASTKAFSVSVDGLPISDKAQLPDLATDLAAARYVVSNSNGPAEIGILASQLDASRSQLRCWHDYVPPEAGGRDDCHTKNSFGRVALLDILVFTPSRDPYDFLEYYYGDQFGGVSSPSRGSGLWTQALCKRLGTGRYASICDKAREFLAPWGSDHSSNAAEVANELAAHAAFMAVAGSEVTGRADAFEMELTATVGPKPKPAAFGNRNLSIDPLSSPFVELPLPKSLRTARGKGDASDQAVRWPSTFAPLPSGFSPVRVERSGKRMVAISVSQNLDPSGEVSAGGYWVHLSHDGRTWEDPLYTGLAERFPYVVREHSKLPLFDGDTLNVEVDIEQVDTASIFYPPVALNTKRRAKNRYLKIPIATLKQDSDGDGITDIVEKHLLLDPHNRDSDGDGIPDGLDSMPNVPHSSGEDPTQGAMAAVIEKMFDVRMGPIIEGIDSGEGSDRLAKEFSTIRIGHTLSMEHPIFIEGNSADFATLSPSRVVLVYNNEQIAQLQYMTPDFHAVSFSPLIVNEAKDRGYLIWSNGWSGGTFRLVREGKKWKVFTISQWIT
jgi:hypothetical protein